MRNKKGFSIVELVVVMSIMGAVAGTAIPVYHNMRPQININSATRQVMGDLMWARMQAVSQNNRYKIFFANDHQYQILDDDNNNGTADADETIITKDLQNNYQDVVFDPVPSPSQYPIFGSDGLLYGSLEITITLENPHGEKSLTVSRTGRVKIN